MIDISAINQDEPFEIDDGNRPHLAKHDTFTEEDAYDVFFGDPIFVDAVGGSAELLMIGAVPGDVLTVYIAPAVRADQIRPFGLRRANRKERERYECER